MKVDYIPIKFDNTSAMNTTKNLMHHKRTKNIDVRHHFLGDNIEKGFIKIVFCKTKDQVAEIFTKTLSQDHFELNRVDLGLIRGI